MAETEQAENVPETAVSKRRPPGAGNHHRVPMTKEKLEARRAYLAQIREEVALEAEEEALQGAREAVRVLKRMARSARDERARYSAAAKIVDIVMPKATGPLVNLSFGNSFISHLGLPPPPPRPEALPGPVNRLALPEPQVLPKQVLPEAAPEKTRIVPEEDYRGRFSQKPIDIEASFASSESVAKPLSAPEQPRRELPDRGPVERLP